MLFSKLIGVVFTVGTGETAVTYTPVVEDIKLPENVAEVVKTTNQGTTADTTTGMIYHEYTSSGMVEPGEISIKTQTDPSLAAIPVGATGSLVLTVASSVTVTCSNTILQKATPSSAKPGDPIYTEVVFKLSGNPVVAAVTEGGGS